MNYIDLIKSWGLWAEVLGQRVTGVVSLARMARKKYMADFETTTNPLDCRVWAYGWMEIGNNGNTKIGTSLDEFMEWMQKVKGDIYFHNLRFDGEFIVNWLLKKGYTYSKSGEAGTFKTTISNMGQWYMIDICYGVKGKNKDHTVIYDSLKKLPFPVKTIAKAFNLDVMKGDIDYHKERPIGYELDEEELGYVNNDVEIMAKALKIQFDQGLNKMTNGSDALTGFKEMFGKKLFERFFPLLSLELDEDIRRAYRGGFTWLNQKYAGVTIENGEVFDVNSLYPSQMYDKELPYGMPLYYEGEYEEDKQYPLYIQKIECEFELKEGYIPTIQIKNNAFFKQTEYLHSSKGERVTLYVTNIDLEMMNEHYELYEVDYLGGWKFQSVTGLFIPYIDKWTEVKVNNKGALRALAKLMLNALYGKFATNPDVTGKVPYLKEDGSTGFAMGEAETRDPVYTPMGVFITSWCRYLTIGTAQKVYDRIIYCDTDSIHLKDLGIPDEIKNVVHESKLGYWKHESSFKRGKYIRQKTYIHEEYAKEIDGKMEECSPLEATGIKLVVKCAGMPDKVKESVTFENFDVGFSAYGKLLPKHVNGGVVLVDTEFTIK